MPPPWQAHRTTALTPQSVCWAPTALWGNWATATTAQATPPSAGTSGHQYDAAGRLTQVTAPDGKQTTYSYDAAGRRVSTERQLNPVAAGQAQAGQAQSLITHQRHDTADRIIAIAQGQYLFFAPRYRYVTWSHLTQWYRSFFRPERVQQIKQFARSKKWAYRKLPVLVGVKNESLVGFGADFDGWNELIAVEEYVLPATHAASEALLTYLRDWEQVFTGYVYRDIPRSSRVQMAGESGLMTALHTSPLVGQEAAMKREVKHSTKLLLEVHDCWSADEVLAHLSTQDTAPALFRYDLVPDMPVADSMKKDWQELYELRVAYLEKFAFPWFYRPALAMLGAEGPRHSLTALQLVEQGVRPLSQPLCPEEFRERVGRVALKLER